MGGDLRRMPARAKQARGFGYRAVLGRLAIHRVERDGLDVLVRWATARLEVEGHSNHSARRAQRPLLGGGGGEQLAGSDAR